MKIAIISDIHLDVNKNFPVLLTLVDLCNEKKIDRLVVAGDISNDYKDIFYLIDVFKRKTQTNMHFVPGNHDLYTSGGKDSNTIYRELCRLNECLVAYPVDLGDWVLVGEAGWYDYSFKDKCFSTEQIQKKFYMGRVLADKKYFEWGMRDEEINDFFLKNLEKQMKQFQDKRIISVTHSVPYKKFVTYKASDSVWNYFCAFMGSEKIGELYDRYKVEVAIFGHTHVFHNETHKTTLCLCRPLGYHWEWKYTVDAKRQIEEALYVLEL